MDKMTEKSEEARPQHGSTPAVEQDLEDMQGPIPEMEVPTEAESRFSEDITVIVGPEAKPFLVRKAILLSIPFFKRCLESETSESIPGTINLAEDDPAAFAVVVRYLHLGRVLPLTTGGGQEPRPDAETYKSLTMAYVLAHKYDMEELQNTIVDAFFHLHKDLYVKPAAIDLLVKAQLQLKKLHALLIVQLAYSLRKDGLSKLASEQDIWDWTRQGGAAVELMVMLMTKQLQHLEESLNDGCSRWHVHNQTAKCVQDHGVEDAHVENAYVEDPVVENPGVEDACVEDACVEDACVEDACVEDACVEDACVEDACVEDTRVEDSCAEDGPVEDARVEDLGGRKTAKH